MANSSRKSKVSIEILGTAQSVMAEVGQSLLECLVKNKIKIDHSCEGMASCGTCRVYVERGLENLEGRTELELEMATERDFESKERLSCQAIVTGPIAIKIPKS